MAEEKGFRLVPCSGITKKKEKCGWVLRLTITEAHYGKRLRAVCPFCQEVIYVKIPTPAEPPEPPPPSLTEAFDDTLGIFDELFGGTKKK